MSEKKIIIVLIIATVLILTGGVFMLSKGETAATITTSQNAKASIDQKTYNWGTLNMKEGNVNKTFTIKNIGTDVLKLNKVRTSCHCTKATVTINGVSSPAFGMNTVSSWIGVVPPNGEAQLGVVFDPAYHGPNGVGPITRYISVDTNDPNNSTLEFTLIANVIK